MSKPAARLRRHGLANSTAQRNAAQSAIKALLCTLTVEEDLQLVGGFREGEVGVDPAALHVAEQVLSQALQSRLQVLSNNRSVAAGAAARKGTPFTPFMDCYEVLARKEQKGAWPGPWTSPSWPKHDTNTVSSTSRSASQQIHDAAPYTTARRRPSKPRQHSKTRPGGSPLCLTKHAHALHLVEHRVVGGVNRVAAAGGGVGQNKRLGGGGMCDDNRRSIKVNKATSRHAGMRSMRRTFSDIPHNATTTATRLHRLHPIYLMAAAANPTEL